MKEQSVRVDEISLTLPSDEAFHGVAHLVLGGLAVRFALTFEELEDIELAVDTLLERHEDGGDVTVRVRIEDGEVRAALGPFGENVLRELDHEASDALDLRRILEAICDRVGVAHGWVELSKRIKVER